MLSLLNCKNLSLSYGAKKILSDVSCSIQPGQSIALIGPNGAGKSTLLKALGGLPVSAHGNHRTAILLNDKSLFEITPTERAKHIAYIPNHFGSELPLTAYDSVITALLIQSEFRIKPPSASEQNQCDRAMELFHCAHLKQRLVATLSTGEKQLIALSRAWLQGARILLLDEATNGIDLHHLSSIRKILTEAVASGRLGFILVSHDINYALSVCKNTILMKNGNIHSTLKTSELSRDHFVDLFEHPELEFSSGPRVFT